MSNELNRLLIAALADQRFCELLLTDPKEALKQGYGDERFNLTLEEKDILFSIQATTLLDFASQLSSKYKDEQSRDSVR